MKAVGYKKAQPIEQDDSLVDIELPVPQAAGKDLLVKVKAISVNPVDTKIRAAVGSSDDEYKVIGWDAVGEVVDVGEGVELFSKGDRVWYAGDLTRPGCNAEYQLVDERIVGHAPASLSDVQAAALPLTTITAWELLFDRLGFSQSLNSVKQDDQRLMIVGASGGVGSILTQLASNLTNAIIIGTASRPESQEWVKQCGANHVIDHRKSLSQELKRIGVTDVTHAISLSHTEQHFDEIVKCITPQGKLALIDDPATSLDIMKLKMKSISLHWEFMFTRSMFQTLDMIEQHLLLNKVAELIDAGKLVTTLKSTHGCINAKNLKKAHTSIESHKTIGKIVLETFT
ncbi:MAG: zinc-binding alcohol dehydrogenase family protein [Pseudomonadota bacterium]